MGKRTKPNIPDEPTYWFRGVEQPPEFTAGVQAFESLLAEVTNNGCTAMTDLECAERYSDSVIATFGDSPAHKLGFAAALAEWLAVGRHSQYPDTSNWWPLETRPRYRTVADTIFDDPGPRSRYFDLDGVPVTVSPDLSCYAFDDTSSRDYALDDVRERGREITRDEFDDLRARVAAPTTEAAHG